MLPRTRGTQDFTIVLQVVLKNLPNNLLLIDGELTFISKIIIIKKWNSKQNNKKC